MKKQTGDTLSENNQQRVVQRVTMSGTTNRNNWFHDFIVSFKHNLSFCYQL